MGAHPFRIEVCVEGVDGLLAAQAAGADRVELCVSLMEGGITPSLGVVREALRVATVPFHVIVRPRGGDFLYSEQEFLAMRADVLSLRELGVAGVVIGCLAADGSVDEVRTRDLVQLARPLKVTFHRAFDMTADHRAAVEALVRCGVDRVLTSGLRDTAMEGLDNLRDTVAAAAGRIVVMACGGLDETNIAFVRRETGCDEVHFAALATRPSGMQFRNPGVGMGGADSEREYAITVTDTDAVRRIVTAARGDAGAP
jgi:copper homeostasis protein